jgi:HEAT repeat protein
MAADFSPADAIAELAFAWKALTVYPADHPAAAGATDEALRQLRALAAVTGRFELVVGRDALTIGEERFQGNHARRLAERLHELEVAVLRFLDGLDDQELSSFLRLLQPARSERRPLTERMAAAGVSRIEVEAIDLSQLRATDDLNASTAASGSVSLWERLSIRQLQGGAGGTPADGPAGVVAMINSYLDRVPGSSTGNDSGAGPAASAELERLTEQVLEAVGEHVAASQQPGSVAAMAQVAELVGAMPRGLRERVLATALAQLSQEEPGREGFALLAASESAPAMVSALRRLRAEGRRIATPAVEWLGTMAASGAIGPAAGAVARPEELKALLAEPDDAPGWVPDPLLLELPPLDGVSAPLEPSLSTEISRWTQGTGIQEQLAVLLELLERSERAVDAEGVSTRLEGLVLTLVAAGRVRPAMAVLQHLDGRARVWGEDERGRALRRALEHLSGSSMVEALVGQIALATEDEIRELHELVAQIGPRLARHLLLALCEAEDRQRRRLLLEFLRRGSGDISVEARALLSDARWYVVRNVVTLLQAIGGTDAIVDLRRCLDHADARVRIEALRALGELDRNLPRQQVARLLADPDPKVAERMAHLAGHLAAESALEPLLAIVTPLDPFGRQRALRIKALLSLGEIGDPRALPQIKRYFGGFGVDAVEERRAAFQSLAGYPAAVRSEWVEKGLSSRDGEIRAICERLQGQHDG